MTTAEVMSFGNVMSMIPKSFQEGEGGNAYGKSQRVGVMPVERQIAVSE
ncbi:MAG TPA: hypothetical protein VJX94_06540 [Stellaceae bacterium]|nr:hypothetical protein [Stellaceae bacterium]